MRSWHLTARRLRRGITAGAEGPTDAVREIARTAIALQADLDARARALLTPALPGLGWGRAAVDAVLDRRASGMPASASSGCSGTR